jgi:transposase
MREGGCLEMSQKERSRLVVMARVKETGMTIKEASKILRLSYRQCRRVYRRYLEEGVVHRNRGRPSNRGKAPPVKE